MPGVIVDIGTGSGEFVYKLAKQYPDRFVIGIDPNHAGLVDVSSRVIRKSVKGGLKNALFILGTLEDISQELEGTANQVFINFPWGVLLRGIVLVEDATWDSIKQVCIKGAFIDILISYHRESEDSEFSKLGLSPITNHYITGLMVPRLEQKGFKLVDFKNIEADDLKNYPSGWAKKLVYGRSRTYYYLRLESM